MYIFMCINEIWIWFLKHLYQNHLSDEIVLKQLSRSPKLLPTLNIRRKPASIFDYEFEDFEVLNYEPDPGIKAPIAI